MLNSCTHWSQVVAAHLNLQLCSCSALRPVKVNGCLGAAIPMASLPNLDRPLPCLHSMRLADNDLISACAAARCLLGMLGCWACCMVRKDRSRVHSATSPSACPSRAAGLQMLPQASSVFVSNTAAHLEGLLGGSEAPESARDRQTSGSGDGGWESCRSGSVPNLARIARAAACTCPRHVMVDSAVLPEGVNMYRVQGGGWVALASGEQWLPDDTTTRHHMWFDALNSPDSMSAMHTSCAQGPNASTASQGLTGWSEVEVLVPSLDSLRLGSSLSLSVAEVALSQASLPMLRSRCSVRE